MELPFALIPSLLRYLEPGSLGLDRVAVGDIRFIPGDEVIYIEGDEVMIWDCWRGDEMQVRWVSGIWPPLGHGGQVEQVAILSIVPKVNFTKRCGLLHMHIFVLELNLGVTMRAAQKYFNEFLNTNQIWL